MPITPYINAWEDKKFISYNGCGISEVAGWPERSDETGGHFAYAEFGDVGALDRRASDTASANSGTAAFQQKRSTGAIAKGARFC